MSKFELENSCKWIFGSIAIATSVYFTKNPNCLWAFVILGLF